MNITRVFIERPVATTLLTMGFAIAGMTAYFLNGNSLDSTTKKGQIPSVTAQTTQATPVPKLEERTERGLGVRIVSARSEERARVLAGENVFQGLNRCALEAGIQSEMCILEDEDNADGTSTTFKVFAVARDGMTAPLAYGIRECLRRIQGLLRPQDNNEVVPMKGRRCAAILGADGNWLEHF